MDKPIPEFQRWSMTKGSDGARWSVYMDHDPHGEWVKWAEAQQHCLALTAAQQQGQAKDCHCATCTCQPGMTPAVRFDTTPADKEGAVRNHLIALGWTPPNTSRPPSVPVGAGAYAALRSILYNAEYGSQDRPLHVRLQLIAEDARRAIAACEAAPPSAPVGDFVAWLDRDWPLWRNNPDNPNVARLRRAWEAALAQQPAAVDEARWQPIATMPTDDTIVLAKTGDGRVMIYRGSILARNLLGPTPEHLKFPAVKWMQIPGDVE